MGNSKRILFVITQADWGGAQTFLLKAAMEAMRRGHPVMMAAGGEGLLEQRCKESGVPYRRLWKMRRELSPLHDIGATRELMALMREWKPDTVFLNSSKAGVVGSIAARLAKVPRIVYRIGGWSFLDPVSPKQQAIRRWSEKLTAGLKDIIITVHPDDTKIAERVGITPRGQVATVPNGLDVEAFERQLKPREDARAELESFFTDVPEHASKKILLTNANFYPAKGLEEYLDAIAIVHRERQDAQFVVIGDGELREALEAKRRALGLEQCVTFAGRRGDAPTLLQGADLFVLPSLKEGMSWAVLEAMAARTPLVVTDVGSNRWVVGTASWIVPARDPQALANALLDALAHPEQARQHAADARHIVETAFSERKMMETLFGILDQ